MEVSNMLDVLHYLFEEDVNVSTAEQLKVRNTVRKSMYKDIYDREYTYITYDDSAEGQSGVNGNVDAPVNADDDFEAPVDPFMPAAAQKAAAEAPKPYFPATDHDANAVNPFQGILREPPLR